MLAKEQRARIPISRPGPPLALRRAKIKGETPLVYDKDGAIQKRCAPGRITYLIDMNGIIRFVQEGIRKSEDLLRELENLKKLERREMRLRAR